MPKNRVLVISGPKARNEIAEGTVIIPTNRIALTNWSWISFGLFSCANLESVGRRAVTIEIVIIECGNIKIRSALLYGVKPTPVVIPDSNAFIAADVERLTVIK